MSALWIAASSPSGYTVSTLSSTRSASSVWFLCRYSQYTSNRKLGSSLSVAAPSKSATSIDATSAERGRTCYRILSTSAIDDLLSGAGLMHGSRSREPLLPPLPNPAPRPAGHFLSGWTRSSAVRNTFAGSIRLLGRFAPRGRFRVVMVRSKAGRWRQNPCPRRLTTTERRVLS
jgi:hypothetical protein